MLERGKNVHLMHMKDARFGYQSRCCAIACHHWDDSVEFLTTHENITNTLACLCRDALVKYPHIQSICSVIACLGLHLVEPFHSFTISPTATHRSLQIAMTALYGSLKIHIVTPAFFQLQETAFAQAVSQ